MLRASLLAIALMFLGGQAWADCQYAGKWYRTGTKIGSKTCQEDGSWR
jgi:hypothetical protein